jgi:hypothetical protein
MPEAQVTAAELGSHDPALVLLTVEEAARRLRIGRTTCFRLVLCPERSSR